MSEEDNSELIQAQKQVIGILFEIIKRYEANSILDEEYFEILLSNSAKSNSNSDRIEKILSERKENSEIVNRLLKQLEI